MQDEPQGRPRAATTVELESRIDARIGFVDREIGGARPSLADSFLRAEPRLAPYRHAMAVDRHLGAHTPEPVTAR